MAHLWAEVGALQYSTHKFSKIQESLQNSWRQRGDTNQSPYRRSTNISAAVKKKLLDMATCCPGFVHPCYTTRIRNARGLYLMPPKRLCGLVLQLRVAKILR